MSVSVFLVDDHEVVRHGVRAVLEAVPEFQVVGEAADGLEAVRLVERLCPDIVVLDLMMPGLNGLDTLRILRQRVPTVRVVILSMYATVAFVSEALECGVSGYVLKGGRGNEVTTAVRVAAARGRYLSPPLSEQVVADYRATTRPAGQPPHELLTPRERQVLQLAAEGKTCPEIGERLSISERTVEKHRASVMHKLQLRSQTHLVLYAVERGIIPPADHR
jgi:two-component system, NarL family, response regulator NreC